MQGPSANASPAAKRWRRGDASSPQRSHLLLKGAYGGSNSGGSPRGSPGPQRSRISPRKDPPSTSPRKELPVPVSRASEEAEAPRWPKQQASPSRCRPSFGAIARFAETPSETEILSHPSVTAYNSTLHKQFDSRQVVSKRANSTAIAFGPGFGEAARSPRGTQTHVAEDEVLRKLSGLRCELIEELRAVIERRMAIGSRLRGGEPASLEERASRLELLERSWEELCVTRKEFRAALPKLGVHVEKEIVASIGKRADPDGTGMVFLAALDGILRWASRMRKSAHVVHQITEPLQGSGVGRARKGVAKDASLEEQLRAAITANPARVEDLFLTWDTRGDGGMNRAEFRHAVQMLGLNAPVAEVNLLFKAIDTNSDGTLSYGELRRAIAKRNAVQKARFQRVEEKVQVADFRTLRTELKVAVQVAEENWNTKFTDFERAQYRHALDDSCPDPEITKMRE